LKNCIFIRNLEILDMSTTEIRSQIDKYLEQLDDSFLKAVHSMLATYVKEQKEHIIGYDINGKPITAEEAKAQYDKDLSEVKNGSYSTLKDIKEKSKQWLKPTK